MIRRDLPLPFRFGSNTQDVGPHPCAIGPKSPGRTAKASLVRAMDAPMDAPVQVSYTLPRATHLKAMTQPRPKR